MGSIAGAISVSVRVYHIGHKYPALPSERGRLRHLAKGAVCVALALCRCSWVRLRSTTLRTTHSRYSWSSRHSPTSPTWCVKHEQIRTKLLYSLTMLLAEPAAKPQPTLASTLASQPLPCVSRG